MQRDQAIAELILKRTGRGADGKHAKTPYPVDEAYIERKKAR